MCRILPVGLLFTALALPVFAQTPPRRHPAPSGGARAGGFAGTFAVTSTTTVAVTSPVRQRETRSTRETAVVAPGSRADLVFEVTNERGERCVLDAHRASATRATFVPGQRCRVVDPVQQVPLVLTLADGVATVAGRALSIRIRWTVAGNAFLLPIEGTAEQRSSGNRR